jgi:hypothetical protein
MAVALRLTGRLPQCFLLFSAKLTLAWLLVRLTALLLYCCAVLLLIDCYSVASYSIACCSIACCSIACRFLLAVYCSLSDAHRVAAFWFAAAWFKSARPRSG